MKFNTELIVFSSLILWLSLPNSFNEQTYKEAKREREETPRIYYVFQIYIFFIEIQIKEQVY